MHRIWVTWTLSWTQNSFCSEEGCNESKGTAEMGGEQRGGREANPHKGGLMDPHQPGRVDVGLEWSRRPSWRSLGLTLWLWVCGEVLGSWDWNIGVGGSRGAPGASECSMTLGLKYFNNLTAGV